MNNQLRNFALLVAVVAVSISSCKKSDDTTPAKTVGEYLTAGYWKTTAQTIDPGINVNGTVVTDFWQQTPACSKDDLRKFNSDGKITDDEGATKCDPNDPQTTNDGTWVLSSDSKSITISYPNETPTTVEIITIDDSQFKGSYTLLEDFGSGLLTYKFTITMTH